MIIQPPDAGWIEVVCGPMFSGKTEELIRRLRRALIAGLDVQIFKPAIDDRYSTVEIQSHDGRSLRAEVVDCVDGLRRALRETVRVVGIDEVQFFDETVVELCIELANRGTRVIVAGLDQDFRARPFGVMPQLLAEAEFVTKSLAICVLCGNPANRSHRFLANRTNLPDGESSPIDVGAAERYQPLCRMCYHHRQADANARLAQGSLHLRSLHRDGHEEAK